MIWCRLRRASAVAISTLVLAHCASADPSPDIKPVDYASDGSRTRLELLGRYSIGCNTSVWNGTPCPPEAPRAYTLPSNPVRVSNSSELIGALNGTTARDIVLADGTYDNSTYFHAKAGHRVWAEHLGKATLTAGIYFDKAPRSEVHGIKFNVNSNAKTHGDSIIHSRPPADYLLVTDSWFEGHMAVRRGLFIQGINGAKAQRLVITHFTDEGLAYRDTAKHTNFDIFPEPPGYFADIDVSYIASASDRSGTAEFGIQIGNGGGTVIERVKCRYVNWSCLIPHHNANGITWRDLDLDYSNDYAFYNEHWTDNNTLERFRIGPHVQSGIAFEGASEGWGNKPAGKNNVIKNGVIDSTRLGIGIGLCNGKIRVENVKFIGQCHAAIGDNGTKERSAKCDSAGPNTFVNNDYSQIDAGAKQVGHNIPLSGASICGVLNSYVH